MTHIRKVLRVLKFIEKEFGFPGAGMQEERRGRWNGYRAGVLQEAGGLQMDRDGGDTIGNTLNAHELCTESGRDDTAPLQGSSAIYCIYSYSMYTPATRYLLLSFSCPFFFVLKRLIFVCFLQCWESRIKGPRESEEPWQPGKEAHLRWEWGERSRWESYLSANLQVLNSFLI